MGDKKKEYDVICIGEVVQDILVTNIPKNPFEKADTVMADDLVQTTGGDAANEAVVLSRLGDHAAVLARLDTRSVGDMIFSDLTREGVDTSLILRMEECETFTSIVVIHPDGNHGFLVGPGKNYAVKLSDIDLDLFRHTHAVSAASLFAMGGLDQNGLDEIFRIAREAGAITVADTNFDTENVGPRAVDHVFPYVDYLMPSYDEAVFISGETDPDRIADFFLDAGVGHVMIKMGGEGCFFKDREERFYMDPFRVTPVDTTGCGDNFTGAFIHCLLKGMDHRSAAEFACAAGALNSQAMGAHMFIQSEEQVEEFVRTAEKVQLNRE